MSKVTFNTVNKTTFNRVKNYTDMGEHFVMVSDTIVKKAGLPFLEVGIMTYLLSMDDKWVVNSTQIQKASGVGRTVFDKAWKHLQSEGYINKKSMQGGGWHWTINELVNMDKLQMSDTHRMSESRQAENRQLISINSEEAEGKTETNQNTSESSIPSLQVGVETLGTDAEFFTGKYFEDLKEELRYDECEQILTHINELNNESYTKKSYLMNQKDHALILKAITHGNGFEGAKESINEVYNLSVGNTNLTYFAPSRALKAFQNNAIEITGNTGAALNDFYNVVYEDDRKELKIRKRL